MAKCQGENKTVSSRHNRTTALMTLQCAVVDCTRPIQDQTSPHSSTEEGGAYQSLHLRSQRQLHFMVSGKERASFKCVSPGRSSMLQQDDQIPISIQTVPLNSVGYKNRESWEGVRSISGRSGSMNRIKIHSIKVYDLESSRVTEYTELVIYVGIY